MQVSVWVPVVGTILVALIAAATTMWATRTNRAAGKEERSLREADLVVSGLSALVDDYREAYKACRDELARAREELEECLRDRR